MASMRLRIVWNRQRRMASRASVHLWLPAAWFHTALRADSIRSRCEQFHTATSCGLHSRLKPWFGSERSILWQEIFCLNIRSNWLARLQIFAMSIKLIRIQYIRSKNLHQVFLPTYPKRNIPKALLTCFQNLKLLVKSAWKLQAGLN